MQSTELKKVTLNQIIADKITESILNKEYESGDRLPTEAELCEKFGVGRHTVREAMKRLQQLGLIKTITGLGSFVSEEMPVNFGEQLLPIVIIGRVEDQNLLEFRSAIESSAGVLAAKRASEQELKDLTSCLFNMRRALAQNDVYGANGFLYWHVKFHETIMVASHNVLFEVINKTLHDIIDKVCKIDPPKTEADFNRTLKTHGAIHDALQQRDETLVRTLLIQHIEDVARRLKEKSK